MAIWPFAVQYICVAYLFFFFFFFFLKYLSIYLLGCPRIFELQHVGFLVIMWVLVPWPGIETRLPALGVQSLSPWTTRKAPAYLFYTQ